MEYLVVLYETDRLVEAFYPLSLTRPVCHLMYGTKTIGERIAETIGTRFDHVLAHPDLETPCPILTERGELKQNILFLSSGFLPEKGALDIRFPLKRGLFLYDKEGGLVGYYLPAHSSRLKIDSLREPTEEKLIDLTSHEFDRIDMEGRKISFLWDLVLSNAVAICGDLGEIERDGSLEITGAVDPNAVVVETHGVVVSKGAKVEPFALLDSTDGPIFLAADVIVKSHSTIEGPAYIGEGSQVIGARVRGGCTFGPQCRVGGEVEQSILQGYVNKYHDGFLGHSYVGSWVNFGAGSTNSDLKNNYKPVRVTLQSETIDTLSPKIGAFVGDHVKLGIGSLMNTGFVCGVGANLFGGKGVFPKLIPSYVWGDGIVMDTYRFDEFEETARTVMSRRNVPMSDRYLRLLRKIFETTAVEREAFFAGLAD
jgi:UDP-N-acetylglucosamine diphosphorylase/glucosamine-1-phosphate N-acetyltransferase